MSLLDLINDRRSIPWRQLAEPGPTRAELDTLLQAVVRVPDHGKLVPFRFILIRGDARLRLGELLARLTLARNPDTAPALVEKERDRFRFAPLIVAVVASPNQEQSKVPAQEQLLTAGCVAYNLLLAAQGLGYGAQWLTGWAAYDAEVLATLGLAPHERLAGFVHIGTAREAAPERLRPDHRALVSEWQG